MTKFIKSFIVLLFLVNCKKDNRLEEKTVGQYRQESIYKNNILSRVKTFNINDNSLFTDIEYKNNLMIEINEYYPDGKIKIMSKLIKKPNHYTEKAYYNNGKLKYQGGMDYINEKKYRNSWWIFYNKTGTVHSLVEFLNDGKNEVVNQKKTVDTINNKIDKENSFYFKNDIIGYTSDSVNIKIEYVSPHKESLDKHLYLIDNKGKEIKKYSSSNYDWVISVSNKKPLKITSALKNKNGKIASYNYFEK